MTKYNPDYYREHRDEIREYRRRYYQEHKAECNAQHKTYCDRNKEKMKEYRKQYDARRRENGYWDNKCDEVFEMFLKKWKDEEEICN